MRRVIGGGLILFVLVGAVGIFGPPPGTAAGAAPPPEVQFNVTGVGRVPLDPDFALVRFAVESISKTAQGAISDNAAAVEALTRQLRTFTRPGDRIETAGFSLVPERGGFVVVNQVQVRTLQVREVGRLVDLAVRAGADNVVAVAFGREQTKEAARQAVREAMQSARESAEAVASGLGMRVLAVTRIEPSLESVEGSLVAREQLRAAGPDTQIQPGRLMLTAHVRAYFVLGP